MTILGSMVSHDGLESLNRKIATAINAGAPLEPEYWLARPDLAPLYRRAVTLPRLDNANGPWAAYLERNQAGAAISTGRIRPLSRLGAGEILHIATQIASVATTERAKPKPRPFKQLNTYEMRLVEVALKHFELGGRMAYPITAISEELDLDRTRIRKKIEWLVHRGTLPKSVRRTKTEESYLRGQDNEYLRKYFDDDPRYYEKMTAAIWSKMGFPGNPPYWAFDAGLDGLRYASRTYVPERAGFSTYAWLCMKGKIIKAGKAKNRRTEDTALSLDAPAFPDGNDSLSDTIESDGSDGYQKLIEATNMLLERHRLMPKFNEAHLMAGVLMHVLQVRPKDVRTHFGLSKPRMQAISRTIRTAFK